jgi:glucuronate isomerase
MKTFITDDFLLSNEFARKLYHGYARDLPIIDYHCHLPPEQIAENKKFDNLTEIWLYGDHYKWRAMRTLGIPERFITGSTSDLEKFQKWAFAVPYTVRNPLYHWTHLELLRYFNIEELLNPDSSERIYKNATGQLQDPSFTTQGLLKKMNVEVVCSTDDPLDNLSQHQTIREQQISTLVLPTFRPDKAYAVEKPGAFKLYVQNLSKAASVEITTYETFLEALQNRVDFFHEHGCRLSDHGLEQIYQPDGQISPDKLFSELMNEKHLTFTQISTFRYHTLLALCRMYHSKGWTQQFHLGALRNNNSRMMQKLGADTGFDSIGDFSQAKALAYFLNELDSKNGLAKTILYNLNPADNEVFASMPGNFNDGSVKGRIQFGSAWWFLDQKDGMEKQINALSNLGLLSCFIGMITDSRSFLSYPRHEYFRRILCNLIGRDVSNGELPGDEKWLGQIVADICYYNARSYFNFEEVRKNSMTHA